MKWHILKGTNIEMSKETVTTPLNCSTALTILYPGPHSSYWHIIDFLKVILDIHFCHSKQGDSILGEERSRSMNI